MDNVEKRLQRKLERQITVEKQKQEKRYARNKKRVENGTKKIYYTILKEVVRNKTLESFNIQFDEFIDVDNYIPFLYCIYVDSKKINLRKTYFDFNKLKHCLEEYGFNIKVHKEKTYDINELPDGYFLKEKFKGHRYVTGIYSLITGTRSKVCEHLLSLNPEQEVGLYNLPIEEAKTYTK